MTQERRVILWHHSGSAHAALAREGEDKLILIVCTATHGEDVPEGHSMLVLDARQLAALGLRLEPIEG